VAAHSIGRFEQAGILERQRNGKLDLKRSVQRLLDHFMNRERWAFGQLRRFGIFGEQDVDVFPGGAEQWPNFNTPLNALNDDQNGVNCSLITIIRVLPRAGF
jgi:hypothetical protein